MIEVGVTGEPTRSTYGPRARVESRNVNEEGVGPGEKRVCKSPKVRSGGVQK